MKVTKYKLLLDSEKKPSLVKEANARYYPELTFLRTPTDVTRMLNVVYSANRMAEEYIWLLALNSKNNLIGIMEISHGTSDSTLLNPRGIFWRLCMCGASKFLLVHNHPSGDTFPSKEDDAVTEQIKAAAENVDIKFLDHIIIGGDGYYSYKENRKI